MAPIDELPLKSNEEFPNGVSASLDEKDSLVRKKRPCNNFFSSISDYFDRCFRSMVGLCWKEPVLSPRTIGVAGYEVPSRGYAPTYCSNQVRNQKYSLLSFVPKVLFEQFRYFLNLYFLLMALSQLITVFKVGPLYTYWSPLAFVIFVTMCREAVDDIRRYRRDVEVNSTKYARLTKNGVEMTTSAEIEIGNLIYVEKGSRIPADMVLIRTTEKTGACFIKTDQLDGETDWKLRLAVVATQQLSSDRDLFSISSYVYAERPQMDIHNFIGTFTRVDGTTMFEDSLNIENTLWANTVLANGTALGLVIYTGRETRSVMNTSIPSSKTGLLDVEINTMTKILFVAVVGFAIALMCVKGYYGVWYQYLIRYIVLFSSIIPLSLRVNLDMGKIVYSLMIMRDKEIEGAVVRSTTIPEELGRIHYLMSDKTGTLTQNIMELKRIHLGTVSFSTESMDEITSNLVNYFQRKLGQSDGGGGAGSSSGKGFKVKQNLVEKVGEAVTAIALCHNVTPVISTESPPDKSSDLTPGDQQEQQPVTMSQLTTREQDSKSTTGGPSGEGSTQSNISYQASSPDEVALVEWTETVGLALINRDLSVMTLEVPPLPGAQPSAPRQTITYKILHLFPFTSETKRMGIIVEDETTGEVTFYLKGADTVMAPIVQYNDWLEEECDNLAREGLRTLVVAKKSLTQQQFQDFQQRYHQAQLAVQDRGAAVQSAIESLERDMTLLCLTGVEDKLQDGVRSTLEILRNAGIRVWMLTGDKLETAACIAKSSCLVSRTQSIFFFRQVDNRTDVHLELNNFRRKGDSALIITGKSLQSCIQYYEHEFIELACQCPAVVVCRCSPTLKADVVRLLKSHTRLQISAIGDGGNDVSMIQASDAGIGIVGKEGKQASMAADFSINQFKHIARLLLVHGRYSYKRSAILSLFVMHRGLILSILQIIFCSVFYLAAISLFPWFFTVGYTTMFTMLPVFLLVLDEDISPDVALRFPELYKTLQKGRELSYKMFFVWCLISVYQGGIIMYGALMLYHTEFDHVILMTFTSLVITELLMVVLTVHTCHWLMVLSEVGSILLYALTIFLFRNSFDLPFIQLWEFTWKTLLITSISCIPLFILKYLRHHFSPTTTSKLK